MYIKSSTNIQKYDSGTVRVDARILIRDDVYNDN